MHQTAYQTGKEFFAKYGPFDRVVEVGACNINGTLRDFATGEWIGVNIEPGPGVDIVSHYPIPLGDSSADAVVASSVFEHDVMFWLTFLDMARLTKPGGYIYINAPSNGPVHRHPVDCWRFYPDAGEALAGWARLNSIPVDLLNCDFVDPDGDIWRDWFAIYRKGGVR